MAKKRAGKKGTAKKRAGKQAAKRRKSTRKAAGPRKTTRVGSKRGPLGSMRRAGKKTWEALKSTTAQMVEGVKDTFTSDGS
jgi:hypothetical protein